MTISKFVFVFVLLLINFKLHPELQKMVSVAPVADLRSKTVEVDSAIQPPALSKAMNGQMSQLLLNECIFAEVAKENLEWLSVQAIEQEIISFKEKDFIPCPGFIEKNQAIEVEEFPQFNLVIQTLWSTVFEKPDIKSNEIFPVCIGTKFEGEKIDVNWWKIKLPENKIGYIQIEDIYEITKSVFETEDELREKVIASALLFQGSPYVFGGRSPYTEKLDGQITGVDCSDFINLVFRSCGLQIPKNSKSQWVKATEIKAGSDMKPGDLIFFFDDKVKQRVNHVMLYLGNDLLIESTGGESSEKKVRIIKVRDYFGKSMKEIESGKDRCVTIDLLVFLGSFLNSQEKIQELRDKELRF